MKLIARIQLAALLPVVVWLAACAPGATSAPNTATTAPAAATSAPVVATTAPSSATSAPTFAATATAANTTAPTTAPTATVAPATSTAAPTLTIAPLATATRAAAATAGITPTGAVISGTGGTSVTALSIKGFIFKPEVVPVKVGTTVTWTNMDDIPHSVTNGIPPTPGGAFDTGFFTQGQSVSLTFMQPGDYTYFCKRHNGMTATVKVVP